MSNKEQSDLEAMIARDLPGWKLSTPEKSEKKSNATRHRVGDLSQIQKKMQSLNSGKNRQTILVQRSDGTCKVADVVNGTVQIVQG